METVSRIILGLIVVILVLHVVEGVGTPSNGAIPWLQSKAFLKVTYA